MQLTITAQRGLIGIQTAPAQMNMENRPARLNMHQQHAAVTIETRAATLEISQYQSRAKMGYKHTGDLIAEAGQRGKQQAMEYTAGKTNEGNRLKAIENGGNPIKSIAMEKAWPQKQRQGSYTAIFGPEFRSVKGEVNITPPNVNTPAHIGYEAEFVLGEFNMNYTPAKVKVYMQQYPKINFDVQV